VATSQHDACDEGRGHGAKAGEEYGKLAFGGARAGGAFQDDAFV
jgi:hypothetical protein